MKKILLSAVALVAAMSVNAQEFIYAALEIGADLNGDVVTAVSGGTELGSSSMATLYIGADDSYKLVSVNGPKDAADDASFRYVNFVNEGLTVAETDMTDTYGLEAGGLQGNSNPVDIDGGNPATTFQDFATGAFYTLDVSADGYAYVIHKASSNKRYIAFEEGSALAYEFAMAINYQTIAAYDLYEYGDADYGYLSLEGDLSAGLAIVQDITGVGSSSNGVGYIGFPIYAGCSYNFGATGSKMSLLGVLTTESEVTDITLTTVNDDSITLKSSDGSTGISSAVVSGNVLSSDAPIYNIAGQRVTASTKGLLIQNGKKFLNK